MATVTGAVRIAPTGGVGVGCMAPSLTVAFIGESEAAPIRAVSLRATGVPGRWAVSVFGGGGGLSF